MKEHPTDNTVKLIEDRANPSNFYSGHNRFALHIDIENKNVTPDIEGVIEIGTSRRIYIDPYNFLIDGYMPAPPAGNPDMHSVIQISRLTSELTGSIFTYGNLFTPVLGSTRHELMYRIEGTCEQTKTLF